MTDKQTSDNETGNLKKLSVSDKDYPCWTTSWYVTKIIFEWKIPGYLVGLSVFSVYWFIPFVFSLLSGTVLPRDLIAQWSAHLANVPDLIPISKYVNDLMHEQSLHLLTDMSYLTDKTHFIFAMIISIGAGISTHVIRNFHTAIINLRHGNIPLVNDENELKACYSKYRKLATHKGIRLMSFTLAMITVVIFYFIARSNADIHISWWGNHKYGNAGVIFAVIVGLMVYWGSRTIVLMGMGSFMLAKFVRHPLVIRPFHPDGCNGLSPLGRLIIYLWLFALALAFTIYVTLSFGYLGIEKTFIVWLLAILGTISIPALAVWPLLSALRSIQAAQRNRLTHFEPMLNKLLNNTEQQVQNNQCDQALQAVKQMNGIQAAHTVINSANVWPFNPRALVGILIVNVIQIVLTGDKLVEIFSK